MGGMESGGGQVEELQGLYGPFSFSEHLLQSIWLHLDFDVTQARTTDGRVVRILAPGRWNRLGGPDFKDARLQVDGQPVWGDVEVHLHARDWDAHRHAADPAYDRVVLHVVLFPAQESGTKGSGGRTIPLLALLPLLHHDLEEYAADEAIEQLADRPLAQARLKLLEQDEGGRLATLGLCAERRWTQKVRYAKLRLERLGWVESCHCTALEILGYRFNRAAMLAVAAAYPLEAWLRGGEDLPVQVFQEFADRWSPQGARPANHPLTRLRQYARWVSANPVWPTRLAVLVGELPPVSLAESAAISAIRRRHRWPRLQALFRSQIFCRAVGGTRANTLICDGLLPSMAAVAEPDSLAGLWNAWPAGDIADTHVRLLRDLGVVRQPDRPLSHGAVQGLLGWLLSSESASGEVSPDSVGSGA